MRRRKFLLDSRLVLFAGVCQCDSGYSGKSCATVTKTLPRFLREDFENSLSDKKWAWVGGGVVATTCGTVTTGKSMVFK